MPGVVRTVLVTAVGQRRLGSLDEVSVTYYWAPEGVTGRLWVPTDSAPRVGDSIDITYSWGYDTNARPGHRKLLG